MFAFLQVAFDNQGAIVSWVNVQEVRHFNFSSKLLTRKFVFFRIGDQKDGVQPIEEFIMGLDDQFDLCIPTFIEFTVSTKSMCLYK